MTHLPQPPDPAEVSRLRNLFAAVVDGTASQEELQECEEKLREDELAREYYLRFVQLQVLLEEKFAPAELPADAACFPLTGLDGVVTTPVPPSILLDTGPDPEPSRSWFAPGGTLFSYTMSALLMVMALLVAWSSTISRPVQVAEKTKLPDSADPSPPGKLFVGRITGAVNCRQANGAGFVEGTFVALGEKFAIADGLLEITYATGAKVLLEGPCDYSVESSSGGCLSLGKLAARVEATAAGKATASSALVQSANPRVKFYVRTPTAVVEDLGTEFAVEVEKSGASKTHVFQGRVEVHVTANLDSTSPQAIPLSANESASIDLADNRKATVVRSLAAPANQFVRTLPQRLRVKVSNSGIGLQEGATDPYWQVVARSDRPDFEPRPAVVTPIYVFRDARTGQAGSFHLPNDPARSAWISLVGDLSFLPNGVTYTFRTTFELNGMLPSTATLWGRIIADDSVTAVRLNGKKLDVRPPQPSVLPLYEWRPFSASSGFIAGKNVLEIDVLNGSEKDTDTSLMSCRVELEASAVRDWRAGKEGDGR